MTSVWITEVKPDFESHFSLNSDVEQFLIPHLPFPSRTTWERDGGGRDLIPPIRNDRVFIIHDISLIPIFSGFAREYGYIYKQYQ